MFEMTVTPRFAETDALGHLSNTTLPIWFEAAREPIFRIFNPQLDIKHWTLILARVEVDFTEQIFLGSDVTLKTYLSRIGNASFVISQEAWQNGDLAAKGSATMVHFDYNTQQSQPIPSNIYQELKKHLINQ